MIALCRLRLINWHNFVNDLLNIQQITYLIGVNGVGSRRPSGLRKTM